jgi:hypothetical protein
MVIFNFFQDVFLFRSFFLLGSRKHSYVLIPKFHKNIKFLLKTQFKTAPKQFFKVVAHEQLRSSIACLLRGSSIVSFFRRPDFSQEEKKMSEEKCSMFLLLGPPAPPIPGSKQAHNSNNNKNTIKKKHCLNQMIEKSQPWSCGKKGQLLSRGSL